VIREDLDIFESDFNDSLAAQLKNIQFQMKELNAFIIN